MRGNEMVAVRQWGDILCMQHYAYNLHWPFQRKAKKFENQVGGYNDVFKRNVTA
jgi:hypothetical protein